MTHPIIVLGSPLVPPAMALAEQANIPVHILPPYTDPAEIAETARRIGAGGIIVRMGRVTPAVLDASPFLKAVVKHGVGYDTIDVPAASERGITVAIAAGANAQSVAEHAFTLMFSVARGSAWLDHRIRAGHWDKPTYRGRELLGRTLGVVGMGSIARILIGLARPLQMKVLAYDPHLPAGAIPDGVQKIEDVSALLERSDIVSLHAPLTSETRHIINAKSLAAMKADAILINTARGELVDTEALVAALKSGHLAGAGLDTFPLEPLPADSPLLSLPNVVLTPHDGASTYEAAERVGIKSMQTTLDLMAGRPVDPRLIVSKVSAPVA